eukprot:768053-Hanusia_phi.AAC.2
MPRLLAPRSTPSSPRLQVSSVTAGGPAAAPGAGLSLSPGSDPGPSWHRDSGTQAREVPQAVTASCLTAGSPGVQWRRSTGRGTAAQPEPEPGPAFAAGAPPAAGLGNGYH